MRINLIIVSVTSGPTGERMFKEIFKSNRLAVVLALFGFLLILAALFSVEDITHLPLRHVGDGGSEK